MRRPVVFSSDTPNACFGCGPDNPLGLRLLFFETDDGIECEWTAPPHVAGAPGIVHGGIQGTVLDEVLCMAAFAKHATPVVTGELTVRYRRPTPTGVPLLVRSRIVEADGRRFTIEGAIHLAETGDTLTEARGRFFAASGKSTE
jgi:acyl-coenzyme A thioesterase PaaI-like protein